ncbi:hypothetical protein IV203_038634 [Nitzschia inconspicua]|uniref:Uncharacterized protein n=1 Tax=Nitzschia inconspicua TaxID=303405 RepID=A0A9K3LNZ2_9STRA|nr:hypothetical protein IV203_038634 [Nitzschia inconspicua]
MLMGPLMAGINGHKVRGKNATSAYENVFGMPLHEPLECDPALLRQCFTVRERLNLLPDPEFEASLQEYYIIDGDPEDPTDYYFEAGSECGDKSEDDSEDDSERTSSREDDKSHQGDGDGQSASHAEPNPHVDIVDMENLDTDDNADMENIDTDATATAPPNGTVSGIRGE